MKIKHLLSSVVCFSFILSSCSAQIFTSTLMTFLYAGVNNPVRIGYNNLECNNISLDCNHCKVSRDSCDFIINPLSQGEKKCYMVYDNRIIDSIIFQVRPLPFPDFNIHQRKYSIPPMYFDSLSLISEVYDLYDIPCRIVNFHVIVKKCNEIIYFENSDGNCFSNSFKNLIWKQKEDVIVEIINVHILLFGEVENVPGPFYFFPEVQ